MHCRTRFKHLGITAMKIMIQLKMRSEIACSSAVNTIFLLKALMKSLETGEDEWSQHGWGCAGIPAPSPSAFFMADTGMLESSKWTCAACVTALQINWLMCFKKINSWNVYESKEARNAILLMVLLKGWTLGSSHCFLQEFISQDNKLWKHWNQRICGWSEQVIKRGLDF